VFLKRYRIFFLNNSKALQIPGTEGTGEQKTNTSYAVKKYKRPDWNMAYAPELFRPLAVLKKTTDYLLRTVLENTTRPFYEVHGFIRDRTRAMMQDITCQV